MKIIETVDQLPVGRPIAFYGATGEALALIAEVEERGRRSDVVAMIDNGRTGRFAGLPILGYAGFLCVRGEAWPDVTVIITCRHLGALALELETEGIPFADGYKLGRRLLTRE